MGPAPSACHPGPGPSAYRLILEFLKVLKVLSTFVRPIAEPVLYFTDRGIEELEKRRGEEEVTFEWLAEQLRTFVDLNPDFEVPVERLATWLARLDDEDDDE